MASVLTDRLSAEISISPGCVNDGLSNAAGKRSWYQKNWFLIIFSGAVIGIIAVLGNRIQPTQLSCSPSQPVVLLAADQDLPTTLRIGIFNVHSLRGQDGVSREALIAEMIERSKCDVLFMQEVRCPWNEGNTPQSKILEEQLNRSFKTKYDSKFLPVEYMWFHPYFGNGLISNTKAEITRITPLPNTRGKGYRQMVEIDVPMKSQTLHLLGTHLDLFEDHDEQLKILQEKFESMPEPKILLGDLNTTSENKIIKTLCEDVCYTSKVDWIIPRGIESGNKFTEENDLASDHPILVIEVREKPIH